MPPYGWRRASAIVRSSANLDVVGGWVRREIARLDPALPVNMETMRQRVNDLAQRPKFNATLLGFFAGLAVLLAAIGLYGVISFLVIQRTREIGVRLALGAQRGDVLLTILGNGLCLVCFGVGLGWVGTLAVTRMLANILFEVKPTDPLTVVSAGLVLAVVGILASYLPARRATKVDPIVALRCE